MVMKAAIVKRKEGYDIFFLNNQREVIDIYGVEGVEIFNTLDDFTATLPSKESEVFYKENKQYFSPEKSVN